MNFVEVAAQGFRAGQREPWIELVVAGLVEPTAFNVEQLQAGHEARQRERIDGELGDRFAGARIGLVVEHMHGTVAYLQKIDVAGDETGLVPDARAPVVTSSLGMMDTP
jgi:hypothetical protein